MPWIGGRDTVIDLGIFNRTESVWIHNPAFGNLNETVGGQFKKVFINYLCRRWFLGSTCLQRVPDLAQKFLLNEKINVVYRVGIEREISILWRRISSGKENKGNQRSRKEERKRISSSLSFHIKLFKLKYLDTVGMLRKKRLFSFKSRIFQLSFGKVIIFLACLHC